VWLGWNASRLHQRHAAINYVISKGGQVFYGPRDKPWAQIPITWRLLGEKSVEQIYGGGHLQYEGDREYLRKLFPEATIEP
jgi:hypothetical protein